MNAEGGHDGAKRPVTFERNAQYIGYRVAASLFGPWSETRVLFERNVDDARCHYMHQGCDSGPEAPCCDKDYTCYGSYDLQTDSYPYAPFLIAPYTTWQPGPSQATIYYLMSVYSPYTVYLMQTTLPFTPDAGLLIP